MTLTNWDVAQDIGLIDRDIGFNIACIFYVATADGKESGRNSAFAQFFKKCDCSFYCNTL